MPYICCTQKLAKELNTKLCSPITENTGLGNWYANLLRIDRKKCVLFTHEQTLYSVFIPSLKKPAFQHLDDIFLRALFKQLQEEKFGDVQVERVLNEYDGKIRYAKTKNRSVLGSMNDIAFQIKTDVHAYTNLDNVNILSLVKRLNRIPFKAIGFEYPEKLFRSRIEQYLH